MVGSVNFGQNVTKILSRHLDNVSFAWLDSDVNRVLVVCVYANYAKMSQLCFQLLFLLCLMVVEMVYMTFR